MYEISNVHNDLTHILKFIIALYIYIYIFDSAQRFGTNNNLDHLNIMANHCSNKCLQLLCDIHHKTCWWITILKNNFHISQGPMGWWVEFVSYLSMIYGYTLFKSARKYLLIFCKQSYVQMQYA